MDLRLTSVCCTKLLIIFLLGVSFLGVCKDFEFNLDGEMDLSQVLDIKDCETGLSHVLDMTGFETGSSLDFNITDAEFSHKIKITEKKIEFTQITFSCIFYAFTEYIYIYIYV